jgi:putative spermidine/putrescine transport system substrate-binding protein
MARLVGRRSLLAGSGAALLAGQLPRPARANRDIMVGTFGGTYEQILRRAVIPGFEGRHGVQVKLELGIGNTFIPKIVASPRRAPFDCISLNEDEAIFGQTAGIWAPFDAAKLPNLADTYDVLKPPSLPLYGYVVYEFKLVYNPDKLRDPTSWADLWRPGITVGIPHISATYGIIFLMIAAMMNDGGETNLEPGFAQLKKLDRPKIYNGVTQGHQMLQRGEVDAALFYGHRAQLLMDQGVNLRAIVPREGTWGQRTGMQIPRAAPNPDLAWAWVDMVLGADYQRAFLADLYSPGNRRVTLSEAEAKRHVWPEASANKLRFADWTRLNPMKSALLERWNREFAT